ncbi:MAG TPA: helix-hairpin-helix domain-containing protein, partial [Euzebyales bacterium]|nr:helix-hairpin-helix domain-containing protein [Euzebyales bacterium]
MQRLHENPGLARRLRAAGEALEIAPASIVALLIVASCACAGLVVLWWTARSSNAPAGPPVGLVATPPAASGAPSAPPADQVVVHVSGAVASPGVRTLPSDARVDDAVRAAGGADRSARTDQLNLARPLRDGEQIHVPTASEVSVAATTGGATRAVPAGAGPAGLVNLNRATAVELEELPGVGPVLAERIIAHREANGGFRSVSELQQVSGIG